MGVPISLVELLPESERFSLTTKHVNTVGEMCLDES